MKPTKTLRTLGLCLLSVFTFAALTGANAQTTLYGTTGGPSIPGSLYTIDPGTGIATLVGPLVDGTDQYAVTGLAFDATGVLYGSTSSLSPINPSWLVTIDPATGAVTPVGSFGTVGTMADLTFDFANSTLYGLNSSNTNLYKITPGTGSATLVGASGVNPSPSPSGMGVAAANDGTVFGTPKGAEGNLFTYDTSSGAAAPGSALTGAPYTPGDATNKGSINALAFSSSSILYGVDVNLQDNVPPNRESHLITINTGSGAVTDIGLIRDIGENPIAFMDAIVFAIPEPSTWLIGVLSLGAIIALRARRS